MNTELLLVLLVKVTFDSLNDYLGHLNGNNNIILLHNLKIYEVLHALGPCERIACGSPQHDYSHWSYTGNIIMSLQRYCFFPNKQISL